MKYFGDATSEPGWKRPTEITDAIVADAWLDEEGIFHGEIAPQDPDGAIQSFTDATSFAEALRSKNESPVLTFGSHKWPPLHTPTAEETEPRQPMRYLLDPEYLFERTRRFSLPKRNLLIKTVRDDHILHGVLFIRSVWQAIENHGGLPWRSMSNKSCRFVSDRFWEPSATIGLVSPPQWLGIPLEPEPEQLPNI